MPLVSVIIPAYNAEKTLLETIESVLQQSFCDFELIVVNDGSTDRTVDILNTVDDVRLKTLSVVNGGVSAARNLGIVHSSGQFISFIDADDLWTADKLASQVAALKETSEAGVAYSWTLTMSEDGKQFYPGKSPSFEGNVYRDLLVSNFIASGSNVMVRRAAVESVGPFDSTVN
ncbi:MAG: glycosyltransferase family 2 protein, partial [Phormidesmis sp.]